MKCNGWWWICSGLASSCNLDFIAISRPMGDHVAPKKLFLRQSVLEMVNQYINTWWHQLLINGSTLQQAPIHRKCNAVIICRKYNVDTQRIMLGFQLFKCEESTFCIANLTNYVKYFHFLMSQQSPCKRKSCKSFLPTITMQPCFSFPTSGQWKAFLCILTKCKLSWPKSYLTQKRCDLDLLITSNPEGFDPFCLSFSHRLLFVSFLGKFWEAEASSRLLRLHISFFLQLTAATGVAFWKKL